MRSLEPEPEFSGFIYIVDGSSVVKTRCAVWCLLGKDWAQGAKGLLGVGQTMSDIERVGSTSSCPEPLVGKHSLRAVAAHGPPRLLGKRIFGFETFSVQRNRTTHSKVIKSN